MHGHAPFLTHQAVLSMYQFLNLAMYKFVRNRHPNVGKNDLFSRNSGYTSYQKNEKNIRWNQNNNSNTLTHTLSSHRLLILLPDTWHLFPASSFLMLGCKICAEAAFRMAFKCSSLSLECRSDLFRFILEKTCLHMHVLVIMDNILDAKDFSVR